MTDRLNVASDTFTLKINLGNDAMQSADDVACALRSLADKIRGDGMLSTGAVMDVNGNAVGCYIFT